MRALGREFNFEISVWGGVDFLHNILAFLYQIFFNLSDLVHSVNLVLVSDRIILEVKTRHLNVLKQNLWVAAAWDAVFVEEDTTFDGDIRVGFEFMVVAQSFRESPGMFRSEIGAWRPNQLWVSFKAHYFDLLSIL